MRRAKVDSNWWCDNKARERVHCQTAWTGLSVFGEFMKVNFSWKHQSVSWYACLLQTAVTRQRVQAGVKLPMMLTTRYTFWFLSKFLSKFLELVTFSESYKTSSPENYLPGCLTINNSSFNCPRKACSRFKKQKVSWLPLTRNLLSNLGPIGTTVFRVLRFWPFKEEVVVALRFGAVCKFCLTCKEVFAKGDFSLVAYI